MLIGTDRWKAVFWEVGTGRMEGLKQSLHGLIHNHIHSLSASLLCFVSAEGDYNLLWRYFEQHIVFTDRSVLSFSAQFLKYAYILVFILKSFNQKGCNFKICDLSLCFLKILLPCSTYYAMIYFVFMCAVHYYWNSWSYSVYVQCYIVPLE